MEGCGEVKDARVRRTEARSGDMLVDMFASALSRGIVEVVTVS